MRAGLISCQFQHRGSTDGAGGSVPASGEGRVEGGEVKERRKRKGEETQAGR